MKLVRWLRFTWDPAQLPAHEPTLGAQFKISAAGPEHHQILKHLVTSHFHLDASWNDAPAGFHARIERRLQELFQNDHSKALIITHGPRIICASIFSLEPDASNHLLTGPCLLPEYSNRGLGTAILYRTLCALKEAGLREVHGVTKSNTPAAKFVYSKFNSACLPYEPAPQAAGA